MIIHPFFIKINLEIYKDPQEGADPLLGPMLHLRSCRWSQLISVMIAKRKVKIPILQVALWLVR